MTGASVADDDAEMTSINSTISQFATFKASSDVTIWTALAEPSRV